MTPSERWPAILLQLEPDAWKRAVDLAQSLGVSERTVYRDVQAMIESGIPLQGVPGKGYRLPEEYLLEPIRLTTDEAVMLVLGSAYAAQNFDGRYRAAARAAQQKIDQVLPRGDRERAFALQGSVHLVPPSAFGNPTEDLLLRRLRKALLDEQTIQISGNGTEGSRPFDPYGLVQKGAMWYLVGYDHDDGHVVHMQLQDVTDLEVTEASFDRPDSYQTPPSEPAAVPDRSVRVVFAAEVAPSVQVAPSLYVADREYLTDGRLLLTLRVYNELEVLPWLLSWGRHVKVLEPQALRKRLAEEARTIARQYQDVPSLID